MKQLIIGVLAGAAMAGVFWSQAGVRAQAVTPAPLAPVPAADVAAGQHAILEAVADLQAVAPVPAVRGWHVAYAHDAEGKPLEGSVKALIAAVKAGKSVRVGLEANGSYSRYDLPLLSIEEGVVTGQVHPNAAMRSENDHAGVLKEQIYHVANTHATTGLCSQFVWSVSGTAWQVPGQVMYRRALTWYVED